MAETLDYLIVGQGLAGSILALELLRAGKTLKIIDEDHLGASSAIAAGIINPITGRRFVKSWMIDELIPFAQTYYTQLENEFGQRFFHPRTMLRFLVGNRDVNEWYSRSARPDFEPYMQDFSELAEWESRLHLPFGIGEIVSAAQINMPLLIKTLKQYFREKDCLLSQKMEIETLEVLPNGISYAGLHAHKIVFCEGHRARFNPYFSFLPFEPAKGEVLTIHVPDLKSEKLIKNKLIIAPLGQDLYWSGTNSEWNPPHDQPTAEFRNQFPKELAKTLAVPFTVQAHRAAIRPSVKDRRPILGHHPRHPQITIFNGFGTKGASLIPFWAKHFIQHLLHSHPLHSEVNLTRFPPSIAP